MAATALAVVSLAGCGDGDGARPEATPSTTEATASPDPGPEPLRIVLVNDDGIDSPALDMTLDALSAEPGVEVTVVVPIEDQSGTGDTRTSGEIRFERSTTPDGTEGWAVDGYPADAVTVALDELDLDPHLVVSGINLGQNVGSLTEISGTVGAGRVAVGRGVPALAVSAGLDFDEKQFSFAAGLAVDWVREHRDALVSGTFPTDTVASVNVPACPVEEMGELLTTELAEEIPEGVNPFESSCDLAGPRPTDDVAAVAVGYPSITEVPTDLGT